MFQTNLDTCRSGQSPVIPGQFSARNCLLLDLISFAVSGEHTLSPSQRAAWLRPGKPASQCIGSADHPGNAAGGAEVLSDVLL